MNVLGHKKKNKEGKEGKEGKDDKKDKDGILLLSFFFDCVQIFFYIFSFFSNIPITSISLIQSNSSILQTFWSSLIKALQRTHITNRPVNYSLVI